MYTYVGKKKTLGPKAEVEDILEELSGCNGRKIWYESLYYACG